MQAQKNSQLIQWRPRRDKRKIIDLSQKGAIEVFS